MNSPITETANFASCAPTTCAAQGKNCGPIPDGCGATLGCGTCTAPQTCGGGGTENVCGSGSSGTATFFQTGVRAGVAWTVTVGGTNYSSAEPNMTVPVSGTVAYTYQNVVSPKLYPCSSGCSGTIGPGGTASAKYDNLLMIRSRPEGADVYVRYGPMAGKFVGTTPFYLVKGVYQSGTVFKMIKAGYKEGSFAVVNYMYDQPYILAYLNPA
jgi:hypothetical protein